MKVRKIALNVLVFLFIMSIGYVLGMWYESARRQTGGFRANHSIDGIELFVYDTEQKLEDYYYKVLERLGIADERSERPLVTVGPFAVFVDNDGEFSVRERPFVVHSILGLKRDEQSQRLTINSLLEKDWLLPRFTARFFYTKEGIYERGFVVVNGKDKTLERIYSDSEGTGIFDRMDVLENGVRIRYHLNGLTWVRAEEQPTEALENFLDQTNHSVSSESNNVDTESK